LYLKQKNQTQIKETIIFANLAQNPLPSEACSPGCWCAQAAQTQSARSCGPYPGETFFNRNKICEQPLETQYLIDFIDAAKWAAGELQKILICATRL
jgi:hypothetical protein